MVSFLKKVAKMAPEGSVKYLLHTHLSGFSSGRPLLKVHASALTKPEGLCPRMYALSDVTKAEPPDEYLTASQFMTFQIGRDQEENIVNWFADMGRAICHWKCVGCGTVHEFCSRPVKCKTCGVKAFKPKEVRFESAVSGASCGIDMLVNLGQGKLRPIELKTMDKEEFKALKAPLAEHRLRTRLYLRIISEAKEPWGKLVNQKEANILYVSKGGFGCADDELAKWGLSEKFSPFKEYKITRDDSETDALSDRAKVVKDFREKKIGMPHGLCPTAMHKRSHGCPMKGACFSGKYPPKHDWTKG